MVEKNPNRIAKKREKWKKYSAERAQFKNSFRPYYEEERLNELWAMGDYKRRACIRRDFLKITFNEIELAISGQEIDAFVEALVERYQNNLNFKHLSLLGNDERASLLKKAIIYRIRRYHPTVKFVGDELVFAPGWEYEMDGDDEDECDDYDDE